MGLDMYLYAEKYVPGWDFVKDADQKAFRSILKNAGFTAADIKFGSPSVDVCITVGYWRKANAIHKWFVDHVQEGKDDCGKYDVGREQIEELLELCRKVLAAKDTPEGKKTVEELLPPQSGFFFGSTEVDEYYYEDIERTVTMLETVLGNPKLEHVTFSYRSSW